MPDVKVGVIGIPGKWSTEVLADALESRTGFRAVMSMDDIILDAKGQLRCGPVNLLDLDGIAIKKICSEYSHNTLDRAELLRFAELKGVQVFSSASSILGLVNRLSCTVSLLAAGIPMPETVITESVQEAFDATRRFGEAVFKPLFSTKARGMVVLGGASEDQHLLQAIEGFKADNPVMYIQRKLELKGQDLGLVFAGGQYLCAYARVGASGQWNTTIHSGGKYQDVKPSQELIDLAHKAQSLFNLDFTTVDIAIADDGPIVFEVSAFGGFQGAKDGSGVDAAAVYADHILAKLAAKGAQ